MKLKKYFIVIPNFFSDYSNKKYIVLSKFFTIWFFISIINDIEINNTSPVYQQNMLTLSDLETYLICRSNFLCKLEKPPDS